MLQILLTTNERRSRCDVVWGRLLRLVPLPFESDRERGRRRCVWRSGGADNPARIEDLVQLRTAPTSIGANALQPADANRYATIVVKPDSDYAGWEALCARTKSAGTLTPADMAREDYPQKRVIGLIVNGSNRAWVVRGAALGTLLGLR